MLYYSYDTLEYNALILGIVQTRALQPNKKAFHVRQEEPTEKYFQDPSHLL